MTAEDRNARGSGSLQELSAIRRRLEEYLRDVKSVAEQPLKDLFSPLPAGFDYFPSSFFLLACRSMGMVSGSVMSFTCAIEALAMAFRSLISLTSSEAERGESPGHDRRRVEGMNLLLVEGLLVLSHRFLTELGKEEFRSLAPLLAEQISELTDLAHGMEDEEERLAKAQRSLSGLALNAAVELARRDDETVAAIEDLHARIDGLLTGYRSTDIEEDRASFAEKLDELSRSLERGGDSCAPLAGYISLVRGSLDVTSSP